MYISYTRRGIVFISLFITICIFSMGNFITDSIIIKSKEEIPILKSIEMVSDTNTSIQDNEKLSSKEDEAVHVWQLEIPRINLIAEIADGIGSDIMNKKIGHFPETSFIGGNVGLAAHNRGYPVNYFNRLKELKNGDMVIYQYKDKIMEYTINKIVIIKDTDWSYLEETNESKITLITCVENEPEYRLCVQGIETRKIK